MVDVGDRTTLTWELGSAATVVVTVTQPDLTTSTPAVSGTSTYTASFTASQEGWHRVTWVASGAAVAAFADVFYANPVTLPGIVSLADAQALLRNTGTTDVDVIRSLALTASELCEQHTMVWRRQTITRTFDVRPGQGHLTLRLPVVSVTSVVEDGATLTSGTDYTLNGELGRLYRGSTTGPLCWLPGNQITTVTYIAAAPSGIIPEPIREGVKHLILHLASRYRGGSGLPRQQGADTTPVAAFAIPYAVLELWRPWMPVAQVG